MRYLLNKRTNCSRISLNTYSENIVLCLLLLCSIFTGTYTKAQILSTSEIPGAADPSRIQVEKPFRSYQKDPTVPLPNLSPELNIPKNADRIPFVLKRVVVKGDTAFEEPEIRAVYINEIGKPNKLSVAWKLAEALTKKYHDAGYFLSRVYVPEQDVQEGELILQAVEGYIHKITVPKELRQYNLIDDYIKTVAHKPPISAKALESFLLRLNDLGGLNVLGSLTAIEDNSVPDGAVELILSVTKQGGTGSLQFDNHGSRFLGPYNATLSYQAQTIPLHETTFTASTSLPTDELNYFGLSHNIPVAPKWSINLNANHIEATPGFTLSENDLESSVTSFGATVSYQAIRQRHHNLSFFVTLDGKNSNGDVFDGIPITRDRIRAARLGISADGVDSYNGYNDLNVTASQGLKWLNGNDEGDANLSRAEADPEFTTLQLDYSRQQWLPYNLLLSFNIAGQYASDPLFSAEEFGYGGQQFGRAYDPSEITGDHGFATALTLAYTNLRFYDAVVLEPYTFYDFGKVWNEDSDGVTESAASTGLGFKLLLPYDIQFDLNAALPLTKSINTPLYGNDKGPRFNARMNVLF